jgi:hypothetical protein
MKKLILSIMIVGTVSACSTKVDYIIDPRVGTNQQEVIRDKLECKVLVEPIEKAKHEKILGVIPFCTSYACMKYGSSNYDPMKKCLENRGHSILN